MGKPLALALLAALAACGPGGLPGSSVPLPPPPPRPPLADGEAAPIRRIEPAVLHGLMTAGDLRLTPDGELVAAIAAHGEPPLSAVVTVCLDVAGTPTGVLRMTSGLPAFDRAALAVVAGWKFRPYVDGGVATPACSVVALGHDADALPPAEIELPASQFDDGPIDGMERAQPPTPGLALALVCRLPGSRAAPTIKWLQSSANLDVDRDLFERRMTAPIDEPAGGEPICSLWSAIARPDGATAEAAYVTLEPKQLSSRLISGEKNIYPADELKNAIEHGGRQHFEVPVRTCADQAGRPVSVTLLQSSGYVGYDMDILNAVASWRYRPYRVVDRPVAFCGMITFTYRQLSSETYRQSP